MIYFINKTNFEDVKEVKIENGAIYYVGDSSFGIFQND